MSASCSASLKPFPCLSPLSMSSAVYFLLTFSSCAQTLPEVLLTEPGLWEWAGSQHWPEISSFNWISRRGGSYYPYTEVGSEKNTPAVSWNSSNGTTSSNHMCRCVSLRAVQLKVMQSAQTKKKEKEKNRGWGALIRQGKCLWQTQSWCFINRPHFALFKKKILTENNSIIDYHNTRQINKNDECHQAAGSWFRRWNLIIILPLKTDSYNTMKTSSRNHGHCASLYGNSSLHKKVFVILLISRDYKETLLRKGFLDSGFILYIFISYFISGN